MKTPSLAKQRREEKEVQESWRTLTIMIIAAVIFIVLWYIVTKTVPTPVY